MNTQLAIITYEGEKSLVFFDPQGNMSLVADGELEERANSVAQESPYLLDTLMHVDLDEEAMYETRLPWAMEVQG